VVDTTEVYLPLDDLIDLDEERTRLAKEVAKMEDEISRVQKKLNNNDFVTKAKEEVIQKERDKAVQFDEKLRMLRSSLEKIDDLQAGRN
jgi:valyl-tRNA synthetase